MNETEHPENGEDSSRPEPAETSTSSEPVEPAERAEPSEHAEPSEPAEDATTPPTEEPGADDRPEDEVTSFYVRRRRAPTLGFWVILALLAPAVVALLISPLFAFADLTGVLNFMLVAAVFVGLPLAALACLIDAIRHRAPRGPRR